MQSSLSRTSFSSLAHTDDFRTKKYKTHASFGKIFSYYFQAAHSALGRIGTTPRVSSSTMSNEEERVEMASLEYSDAQERSQMSIVIEEDDLPPTSTKSEGTPQSVHYAGAVRRTYSGVSNDVSAVKWALMRLKQRGDMSNHGEYEVRTTIGNAVFITPKQYCKACINICASADSLSAVRVEFDVCATHRRS